MFVFYSPHQSTRKSVLNYCKTIESLEYECINQCSVLLAHVPISNPKKACSIAEEKTWDHEVSLSELISNALPDLQAQDAFQRGDNVRITEPITLIHIQAIDVHRLIPNILPRIVRRSNPANQHQLNTLTKP